MKIDDWFDKYKFRCEYFKDIERLVNLKKEKKQKISVCIPTLNEEEGLGKVISTIKESLMDEYKLIDEIIVIDSGSTDNTKNVAIEHGAKFYLAEDYLKIYGKARGKGENLWKSLYLAEGDIICWVDADIKNIHPRFVYGLIGPLLTNDKLYFTKAFYQRPIKKTDDIVPLGGGRTTELCFRPLINMFFPMLSGFIQPLSGEYAGRRKYLEKLPFFTGYGVETGLLIDIQKKFGLRSIAQVDLISRTHRNQDLTALSKQAFGIIQVISKRANTLGKFILVRDIRQKIRIIERSRTNGKIEYKIKPTNITQMQRPPIITLKEYRKKFKREPSWYYV
jgi:glucosyl-3-phosphoglycerate synthase